MNTIERGYRNKVEKSFKEVKTIRHDKEQMFEYINDWKKRSKSGKREVKRRWRESYDNFLTIRDDKKGELSYLTRKLNEE